MAMRDQMSEKVVTKVVKGLKEDVVSGSKRLWDKVSSGFKERFSFHDNFDNLPRLTKTGIMSPTDIPDLGDTVEDEEVMDTVPSLSEGSQLAETTGELSSMDSIVALYSDADSICRETQWRMLLVFRMNQWMKHPKDMVGSKVSNLSEGTEKVSHAETHFSADEYVAEHVHNGDNTIAKLEDSPSVYYYYPSPANTQKVVAAVPVLEAVDSSPIEPIRRLPPLLPKFNDFNLMGGNILSRNSTLDPISIPRIEEDEFIDNLPNAVVHKGSKLYEASSGVWVAEPIVRKPSRIDKY